MSITLIVVMVSWEYAYVQTHCLVQLITCSLLCIEYTSAQLFFLCFFFKKRTKLGTRCKLSCTYQNNDLLTEIRTEGQELVVQF